MQSPSTSRLTIKKIWFPALIVYIVSGYLPGGGLFPSPIKSYILYAFLGISLLAILSSRSIKKTPIIKWQLSFLVVSLVTMAYSPSFSVLGGTYYMLIVNFIIVFILSQMRWNEKMFQTICTSFMLAAVALILILAITGNLEDSDSGRLGQQLFGNANILAMMLMVSAVYGMWILISVKSKLLKTIALASLVVIYFGMFLSGGRKYVVIPIIFAFFVLISKVDKRGRSHIIKAVIAILVVTAIVYHFIMNVEFFYNIIGYRFEGFFALLDGSGDVDTSTAVRMKMIDAAFSKWLESPILGYGFDSFKYYNAEYVTGHMYYSHNNFVELLYNQGFIGFVCYYSFYVYLIYATIKRDIPKTHKGFVLGVVFSLLVYEYFGITYSTTPSQILLFFAYYVTDLSPRENEENKSADLALEY